MDPLGSTMMSLVGLQIYLRPRVTLNFDLLTLKAECFMPLPREPLVSIGIEIVSLVFKISCLQFGHRQTNG